MGRLPSFGSLGGGKSFPLITPWRALGFFMVMLAFTFPLAHSPFFYPAFNPSSAPGDEACSILVACNDSGAGELAGDAGEFVGPSFDAGVDSVMLTWNMKS